MILHQLHLRMKKGFSMIEQYKRFDLHKKPTRQWHILRPITWIVSFPVCWYHLAKLKRPKEVKQLNAPYLLLCNHNSFMDFMITTRALFPLRANYIVAIDGFISLEWLLRKAGGIGTRKFSRNLAVVKNMFRVRQNGDVIVMYPEARYSLCGTQAVLPDSLGKIIRKLDIPVVTLIMHGHHINSPFWNVGNRGVRGIEAEMQLLLTAEETQTLSVEEINQKLAEAIVYDDFAWQKEKGIKIKKKDRAEGLHKVLYQCPSCLTEFKMLSEGSRLICGKCGKIWEMSIYGELEALDGTTEFSHIPDWYEWERANVRKEVEEGSYHFEGAVRIESLPNSKGHIAFEKPGILTHNMDGFTLHGESPSGAFTIHWKVKALYSCHIEYNYKNRGDCVDLNTNDDTFYCFPLVKDFSVTKFALATEELYNYEMKRE